MAKLEVEEQSRGAAFKQGVLAEAIKIFDSRRKTYLKKGAKKLEQVKRDISARFSAAAAGSCRACAALREDAVFEDAVFVPAECCSKWFEEAKKERRKAQKRVDSYRAGDEFPEEGGMRAKVVATQREYDAVSDMDDEELSALELDEKAPAVAVDDEEGLEGEEEMSEDDVEDEVEVDEKSEKPTAAAHEQGERQGQGAEDGH